MFDDDLRHVHDDDDLVIRPSSAGASPDCTTPRREDRVAPIDAGGIAGTVVDVAALVGIASSAILRAVFVDGTAAVFHRITRRR